MVCNYFRTYTGDDSDITATTSTTMDNGVYTVTIRCYEESKVFNEDKFLRQLRLEEIKEIREGWLKPHKQLKPFYHHSKITYNLPRGRIREKKQIFKQAA